MFLKTPLYRFLITISLLIFVYGQDRTVLTTHGLVTGKILKTLLKDIEFYGFMGIPYAAAPIKDLRFLPPKNIESWNNVLFATKNKTPCVQFNQNIKKTRDIGQYGLEDCLYLNIFTPATDNAKRAVIIFLYNEHFKYSYNNTDYSPDFFIEENVVIVEISHRLSIFGFLSFEDDILPGNSGLKDIVMGLQWIKNNAESFGGDPNKITLMGMHGGAVTIDLLVHTKAKTLINAAILQSGTSLAPEFLQDNAKERAHKLGNLLNKSTSDNKRLLQDLNEISADELFANELKAIPDDYYKENQRPLLPFGPIVEKQPEGLVIDYPEHLQTPLNMPVMIGSNSREGLESSLPYLADSRFLGSVERDFHFLLPIRTNFKFNPLKNEYFKAINEIKKFYFKRGKVTAESISDYITYIGDVLISYPVNVMAGMYANKNSNSTFYYHFDYYSELNENKNAILKLSKAVDGTWGAASGDELCYLFMCPRLKDHYIKLNQTLSEEFVFQKKLIKLWTNFAKYGNPTPKCNNALQHIEWPKYNIKTREYLHINKKFNIKRNLFENRFKFWERFLNKWQGLLNNASGETYKDEL